LIFVRRIPGAFRNAGEGTGSEAERMLKSRTEGENES